MSSFSFVGTGNMGGALATAVCKAVNPKDVTLANKTKSKAEILASKLGCLVSDNADAATKDYVFLGVKPGMMADVIDDIRPSFAGKSNVLISMAAALSIEKLEGFVGEKHPIVRIMPNTPVSVGEGVILYSKNAYVTDDQMEEIIRALSKAGSCYEIAEKLIDAGSAVAGCGPAFCQMFIEGLADGAVACGIRRDQATEFAAKMVLGSAKLTLESGKNPGQLREEVCSPGGSTIEGVRALENNGFRAASMEAVIAAYEKTLKMK